MGGNIAFTRSLQIFNFTHIQSCLFLCQSKKSCLLVITKNQTSWWKPTLRAFLFACVSSFLSACFSSITQAYPLLQSSQFNRLAYILIVHHDQNPCCTYIHTYIYIYIYIYTIVYIYIYIFLFIYIFVYVYKYIFAFPWSYTFLYIHVYPLSQPLKYDCIRSDDSRLWVYSQHGKEHSTLQETRKVAGRDLTG